MTCESTNTIFAWCVVLTLILIVLLLIASLVRTGVNPCTNGISSQCSRENMDEICSANPYTFPACRTYCRKQLAQSIEHGDTTVCESEFCINNTPVLRYCTANEFRPKRTHKYTSRYRRVKPV